jgi:predicted Zn-dependent protease
MPGLMAAEKSFRAMTTADQQAARPWQVKAVPFPRGGFAELARQSPVPEKRLQLLNGTWGRSDPAVGQMVKTVVEQ